jgi:hypothetical protein
MIVLELAVMIGFCIAIMEQGARKAHLTTKERSIAKQPRVKVGDRVRIIESNSRHLLLDPSGVVVSTNSLGNSFDMKTIDNYKAINVAELYGDRWEIVQPTKEKTMKQQTFKVGDRVRIKTNISSDIYGRGKIGVITDDHNSIDWPYRVRFDDGKNDCFMADHLEHLMKTLDNLVEGDVVVDKDDTDDIMTVLHVLKPGLYVLVDSDEATMIYNAKELDRRGFILQQDPEDDKTSMTVAEVAKKLGLDPEKLHIVADKKAA